MLWGQSLTINILLEFATPQRFYPFWHFFSVSRAFRGSGVAVGVLRSAVCGSLTRALNFSSSVCASSTPQFTFNASDHRASNIAAYCSGSEDRATLLSKDPKILDRASGPIASHDHHVSAPADSTHRSRLYRETLRANFSQILYSLLRAPH